MNRKTFIDVLKNISDYIEENEDKNKLSSSRSLTFYFLQKLIENTNGYYVNEDIINSIIDGPFDRGIDAVYIEDSSEDNKAYVYIIQTKYTENEEQYTVDEKEAIRFVNNFNEFPYINGEMCVRLREMQKLCIQLEQTGVYIEKIGIVITLGRITNVSKNIFENSNIEIYNFDRINSEILLDEYLPDIEISLYDEPSKYNGDLQGILVISDMLRQDIIRKCINDNSLFAYNIRGIMNTRKNSIFESIKKTCVENPKALFRLNNGINIVCEEFEERRGRYFLKRASVVNGQQTIRAIFEEIDNLDKSLELCVPVKILKLGGKHSDKKQGLIYLSKSANRQNIIKDSDLFSNEEEQRLISELAVKLPNHLKFSYIYKREFNKQSSKVNIITKEEVAKIVNAFLLLNPNDRVEDLFKNHYNSIFGGLMPQEVSLIKMFKNHIEELFEKTDENSTNKFISKCVYIKFKKDRTVNFSLYILSLMLSEIFYYREVRDRRLLLNKIFNKAKNDTKFKIQYCFNDDFWHVFISICIRLLNKLYDDNNITGDYLRKPLENKTVLVNLFNQIDNELAFSKKVEPKIIVE